MKLSNADYQILRELEESLWKSETRYNLAHQEKLFASDFFEFGRSGKRYTREQLIRTEASPINANLPLKGFQIHVLDTNNVLVTYISEVQYETLEISNRCSVWTKTADGWKLRFHQGSPLG